MNLIPDNRHPNSPLIEVVFEIRFPGETAIECKRSEIQDCIRDIYPNLLVPKIQDGMAYALEPYRFEKSDASAGVMVSLNRFGYFSRAYPGFEDFKKEYLRLLGLFGSIIKLNELNRVGLRHVNIIPFVRENRLLPLEHFFVFCKEMMNLFPGRFENFSTAFVLPAGKGKITTRIESVMRTDGGQEAFLLDFDYAKSEGDLEFDRIEEYLDEAHTESALLFHTLITENYRAYIKGEET
ncbi:TIGR04255 family protein [Desulfomonile tiedjei]|uniref:TIGR04255 family protein n=1 Tax=Desulfomonile tiedjei (strain ATCC 49306 / DSM 6799 / DCB-1) TaxID=706587 RepID=I4C9M3_DESTA|nr:TIGR04255 family protein [Desulfomonile tiedjei]AFM26264.1 hypothetical protein Desti_3616 [Desulfomonile tiedjei DSM 6799]